MLSIGSEDDGRRTLGLGPRYSGQGGMEENELEEGEAISSLEYDAIVDPDVSLSYIDEKIQVVLGHFQKVFDGEVSPENSGAKLGEYGSFLPVYLRLPSVWSQPRVPGKVTERNTSTSVHNPPTENTAASISPSVPSGNNSVPVPKHLDDTKRNKTCTSAHNVEELTPQNGSTNKSHNKGKENNLLKVRIKVGSGNVLLRPLAAIYSDMGLDYSPSSSPEDSPGISGGISLGNSPGDSPMAAFQIMTCFPVSDGYVLSPLPESMLHLMENESLYLKSQKSGTSAFGVEVLKSDHLPANGKISFRKKVKNVKDKMTSSDLTNSNRRGNLRTKADVDIPVGRALVSDALCTPTRSNSHVSYEKSERIIQEVTGEDAGRIREPKNAFSKDKTFLPYLSDDELLEVVASSDARKFGEVGDDSVQPKGKLSSKTRSTDRTWEEDKLNDHKVAQCSPYIKGAGSSGKNCVAINSSNEKLKVVKDGIADPSAPDKLIPLQHSSLNEDGEINFEESGTKRRSKGCEINDARHTENPKESVEALSSAEKKKRTQSKRDHSLEKQNAVKSLKELSKSVRKELHRDSPSESKAAKIGCRTDSTESPFREKVKANEKDYSGFSEKSNESQSAKKAECPPQSETHGKDSEIVQLMVNGPTTSAAAAPSSHVVIEDNWVLCDKCQKWRLLPYGTDPTQLPRKWLCTMLNWLPGMNKCSISEEETTRALHASYQAPLAENQITLNAPGSQAASGAFFINGQYADQNHHTGFQLAADYGKKKHSTKDVPSHGTQLADCVKNRHASFESVSLTENQVNSNGSSKYSFEHMSKSAEFNFEKVKERGKKKHRTIEQCSTGGEVIERNGQISKSKNKKGSDQDGHRVSKKVKVEGAYNVDEDWYSDHRKSASMTSSGIISKSLNISSSKDSKTVLNDSDGSRKKSKVHVKVSLNGDSKENSSACYGEKLDKKDYSGKKRKEARLDYKFHAEAAGSNKCLLDDGVSVKEEISRSESRKEKKARISKMEERGAFKIKMDDEMERRNRGMRISSPGGRERPHNGMENENKHITEVEEKDQFHVFAESEKNLSYLGSKRDLSDVQPSTAATSSSSKVSGSSKNKSNFQETRGSPVESVSSSPLRTSNADSILFKTNAVGTDATNAGFSVLGSQRGCSNGEVFGAIDKSVNSSKGKSSPFVHNGSLKDYQDADFEVMNTTKRTSGYMDKKSSPLSFGKTKDGMCLKSFPEFEENIIVAGNDIQCRNHILNQEKQNYRNQSNGSGQQKSLTSSLSRAKEKHKSSNSGVDKYEDKISDSVNEKEGLCSTEKKSSVRYDSDLDSRSRSAYQEDLRDGNYRIVEKKDERRAESVGKLSSEATRDVKLKKSEVQASLGTNNLLVTHERDLHSRASEAVSDSSKTNKHSQLNKSSTTPCEDRKSSNFITRDQPENLETTPVRGKSQALPHSGDSNVTPFEDSQTTPVRTKGGKPEMSSVNATTRNAKLLEQPRNPNSLRLPITHGFNAPSPVRRDGNHSAASVLKEARDLKHTANRLKAEGLEHKSTGLYFEAALKFLHVAFLLEFSSAESGKHGESTQAMAMYSDTAKLCEFCAHEYERRKEMAAAALAYKCMEVAYMKVVFSKHSSASKDRHELQTALQMVPSGESPSSSASDIDNLNNQSTANKSASLKAVNPHQMVGTHVIAARNRPTYMRLLDFAHDVNYAMEASRKSQHAFTAANACPEESQYGPEGIASVRRVLDLSFHDVEGLLHLVRQSLDSISRLLNHS
ncbi:unnamed protein product [Spirodela intermedia]|uniref:CW-type domain-containing protein n=1 Tax=Spirodela intermedia TaxID=51605 RepID=A0A7I8L7M0_SPIIN|nr:unnamed protein product [Spirodela intermedia]